MTFDTPTGSRRLTANPHRADVLKEIALRWSRFSTHELAAITTNDQLVHAIMRKCGVGHEPAQRDVDTLMAGRNLSP